jgi:uncharacterized cupredoxin-like copper-binding protein
MTHARARRILIVAALCALASLAALAVIVTSTQAGSSDRVSARLSDFRITASPSSADAGRVTFTVRNTGQVEHELIVIKTRRRASDLPLRNGRASERGSKGDVEVDTGERKRLSLNLTAGHYVLICNIGQHYRAGMRRDFTVR